MFVPSVYAVLGSPAEPEAEHFYSGLGDSGLSQHDYAHAPGQQLGLTFSLSVCWLVCLLALLLAHIFACLLLVCAITVALQLQLQLHLQ